MGDGGRKGCEDTDGETMEGGDFSVSLPRLGVGALAEGRMMAR